MVRKIAVLSLLALSLIAGAIAYSRLTADLPTPRQELVTATHRESAPETETDRTRRKLLGVWQDHYKGTRTMTLKEDGTGTILVELTGLQATLFASKMRFDMRWVLDGKILKKESIGGEPEDKVKLILNTMGTVAKDTIQELTEDRLLLLDADGKTQYEWKRIEPAK